LYVGSYLLITIVSGVWFRIILRRELPALRPSMSGIRRRELRMLALFSSLAMLIAVGNLLGSEGFRILISKRLGMAQVGIFSALLAFRTMASTLIENMSNVLTPTVSTLEARDGMSRIAPLFVSSTKYASAAAALICIVPLCVAGSFLGLWLGDAARP